MTRGQLLSRVGELMGDTSSSTSALLTPWVGLVLSELALHGVLNPDAEWTTTLTVGQRAYQLPPDMSDVQALRLPAVDRVLTLVPSWTMDQFLVEEEAERDDPEFWTLTRRPTAANAGEIKLHKTPSEARTLVLRGDANFTVLTNDANIIELLEKHTTAIIFGLYRFGARFDSIGDIPDASAAFERAIADIKFDQQGRITRVHNTRFNDL